RSAVDLVREQEVAEDGTELRLEGSLDSAVDARADEVGRDEVRRELDAAETAAEDARRRLDRQGLRQARNALDQQVTLREQADERFLAGPSLGEATRKAYRADVEDFLRWLGQRPLEGVGVRILSEYVADLGRRRPKLAPATISRRLAAVRGFLRSSLGPARVPD